jgi:hypothetical protein
VRVLGLAEVMVMSVVLMLTVFRFALIVVTVIPVLVVAMVVLFVLVTVMAASMFLGVVTVSMMVLVAMSAAGRDHAFRQELHAAPGTAVGRFACHVRMHRADVNDVHPFGQADIHLGHERERLVGRRLQERLTALPRPRRERRTKRLRRPNELRTSLRTYASFERESRQTLSLEGGPDSAPQA